jgi:phosphoribosyl-ATP pyrophosphohydrolase/phosphoribosyl-AMP cyclohydrolase
MKNKPNFKKMNGLIPAIIQDSKTNEVLMLGFMNNQSWEKTQKNGKVTFWSRTRKKIWTKGETSGNFLYVKKIYIDCDNDTILIKATPKGPTCHTGNKTCFFNEM